MSSSGVKQCAAQRMMCTTQIVGVNVVIGVLVVHFELLVVRVVPLVVCDDAVGRRTLVLLAVAVGFVFVVAILHRIVLYWSYYLHLPSVTVNCCWLLPNFNCNLASN